MAISNQERVVRAMDLLRDGLRPFAERELKAKYGDRWAGEVKTALAGRQLGQGKGDSLQDVAVLLAVMDKMWGVVFGTTLGRADRNLVLELIDVRNRWAHQEPFSSDDTDRALDSMSRLLTAVSAPQAEDLNKMKMELRREIYDQQLRHEKRKAGGSLIEAAATRTLKPWRDVVTPHKDVRAGSYQQAEFAADLWQVHMNEGSDEYRKPQEFFRRTFLTESLKRLLVSAVRRVSGQGGDPVVQLQTNFGGGKTHSMMALYHLFSGVVPADLPGADAVLAEAGVTSLPKVTRVVLVGNRISPGNPATKPDGTVIRTLWGELAYQLGGKPAYERIRADDEKATSPGDALRELLKQYGPSLILIDEWVAYARQLHDQRDLPGGTFDTQFTFAQTLTEAAKHVGNCLLVVSLPASDTQGSPHTQADDTEVGGIRGREALERLRNVVGRLESSWRPASAEESFEIVRRRLFEAPAGADAFKQRDLTARSFSELYRTQSAEFPAECKSLEYEKRIQAAYPIHPEIFDQLYGSWSTLVKFQRTRGVLRLMATVIHSLWDRGDKNPLILPSTIPLDDARVQFELTRYLSDNWAPILERDVDGPGSLPTKIDADQTNLGRLSATRRVARTIFLGSAPTADAAHRGIEDRRVKLGCVMPGESPQVFGDALRRLAAAATYLYQEGPRFWYATQPTVQKLAEDHAEQLKRDPDKVAAHIGERLRAEFRTMGGFARIHDLPRSGADVPDDRDARLVVLGIDDSHTKDPDSRAIQVSKSILESRGNSPRIYRNALVFLAADKVRLQDLDDATRRYLAWKTIVGDAQKLNLDPQQLEQAKAQLEGADAAVKARLPETYQWLLVPGQTKPDAPVDWQVIRLSSGDGLAERAMKKLRNEELLVTNLAGTRLRMELDKVLWRGDHVGVKQLAEDFARYLYLPRLANTGVLLHAAEDGVSLLTWAKETFAYADGYDEKAGRYQGLRGGRNVTVSADGGALVVKSDVARKQLDAETAPVPPGGKDTPDAPPGDPGKPVKPLEPVKPKRFHGTVELDPARVGRDASRIADEVLAHLAGLVGADVRVTLEIDAKVPGGVPDTVVRTVTENSRTLRFASHGFETD